MSYVLKSRYFKEPLCEVKISYSVGTERRRAGAELALILFDAIQRAVVPERTESETTGKIRAAV